MSSPTRLLHGLCGLALLGLSALAGCGGEASGSGSDGPLFPFDINNVDASDVASSEDAVDDVDAQAEDADGAVESDTDASEDVAAEDISVDVAETTDVLVDVAETTDVAPDTPEDAGEDANDASDARDVEDPPDVSVDGGPDSVGSDVEDANDTHSDIAPDGPADTSEDPDADADGETDTTPDADAATDVATDVDPDVATDVDPDVDPDVATDVDPDVATDVDADVGTDTDTSDAPDIAIDADAADADAADADAGSDTDAEDTTEDVTPDVGPPPTIYPVFYAEHTSEAGLSGARWVPTPLASGNLCGEVSLLTGGAAIEDYDNDGDLDVFMPRLGLPAQLWTNDGDGTFIDRAESFGIDESELSNGAAWFDADGDGTFELFVSQVMGLNRLWQQTESGDWVDVAESYGLSGLDVHGEQACQRVFGFQVGRVSDDDILDIILVRWGARYSQGATQILFGMEGGGWRAAYGTGFIADGRTTAFTAHIFDFMGDDANDIYLTADFGRSRAYENNEGVLRDITDVASLGTEENGMGTAIGDINADGHLDLFVTSIYGDPDVDYCNGTWGCSGNRLWLGTGDGFVDATDEYGVREGGWGWGAVMFDADNDTDTDLAMVNGYNLLWEDESLDVYRERSAVYNTDPSRLWRNDGAPFTEIADESGFLSSANERAVIPFDMDRDGDLDILVIRNDGPPRLLKTQTDPLVSGVSVRFSGRPDHGINSVVTLRRTPETPPLVGYLRPFGLQSSSRAHEVHFGLGEDAPEVFYEISVAFEDGATAQWRDVPSAALIVLDLEDAEPEIRE